jgi:hypothetical protein
MCDHTIMKVLILMEERPVNNEVNSRSTNEKRSRERWDVMANLHVPLVVPERQAGMPV